MGAPQWEQGYGLSWSGKWHAFRPDQTLARDGLTLCGVYVYTRDFVPATQWLLRIARGRDESSLCKRCERIKAKG